MRVLILGGTGYLGSNVHNHFLKKKYDSVAAIRSAKNQVGLEKTNYNFIDFTRPFLSQIKGTPPSVLINFIGPTAKFAALETEQAMASVERISNKIVKEINESSIKKVINISTVHVYSNNLNKTFTEQSLPLNNHPYAKCHKLKEEIFYNFLRNDIHFVNIRLSNSFGPPADFQGDFQNLFVNQIIKSAIKQKEVKIFNNKFIRRDFITIADLLTAIEKICFDIHGGLHGNVNLAGKSMSLFEMAHKVRDTIKAITKNDIKMYFKSNEHEKTFENFKISTKLAKSFGIEIKNNFEEEISRTCRFLLD